MRVNLGVIEWVPSDEFFRPTLWVRLPHSRLVFIFGWEWPPRVVWL